AISTTATRWLSLRSTKIRIRCSGSCPYGRIRREDGRIRDLGTLAAQGAWARLAADAARHRLRLVENATMLQMCAELGFHMQDMGSDIRRVVLDLENTGL